MAKRGPGRPRKSWNNTETEDLQNIQMTWTDYGEISDDGQCDKAVLPSVFPEHLEGLRSKVRYLQNYCNTEKRTAAK